MKVVCLWFIVLVSCGYKLIVAVKRVLDSVFIFKVSSKKQFLTRIWIKFFSVSSLYMYIFISFFWLQKRPFHSWSVSSHLGYKIPRSMSCCMSSAAVASQASFSAQSLSINEPVVSADWLHANLRDPNVKVCCSYICLTI